jgi:hypothetical protein
MLPSSVLIEDWETNPHSGRLTIIYNGELTEDEVLSIFTDVANRFGRAIKMRSTSGVSYEM